MKRNKFSLSNYKLLSCDMGELVPIGLTEVLPGDSIQQSTSLLLRCSPLVAPVMHPVHVYIRHFFVPSRILWDDFEDFITGGPDGLNASVFPTIALTNSNGGVGSLADYLGIVGTAVTQAYNALPFRAYAMIYNEFFRDQDLQTELALSKASGLDSTTSILLKNSNWEKDYFTTARPWEQKGPAVNIPVWPNGQNVQARTAAAPNTNVAMAVSGANPGNVQVPNAGSPNTQFRFGDQTGLQISIDLLRQAFAVQRFEEARARYGSRYVEYLRYLGVRSSDARLQRPEYLGGGKQTIQFSEVLQTAEGTDPVGDLKGHGIAAMRSNRYRRFFEEHGYIMSLMTVRPKTVYVQGSPRLWNKRTREEFWQKELEHIGQQEVTVGEIYGPSLSPGAVFGYQNRYEEYRRTASTIAGEFRTSTLDYWHMARIFSSEPALNSAFVTANPTKRTFAVQNIDGLYVEAHHSIQARRMVSAAPGSFVF